MPSLRCLDYVARRIAGLPVLIVLTESPRTRPWHPEVYAELLRPARLRRIRLPLLTADGTYQLLAGRLGAPAARRIADECHEITAGNPLLVQALSDDHLAATAQRPDRPIVGEAFREAVLSCLYRCEHLVLKAARALAVTGGRCTATCCPTSSTSAPNRRCGRSTGRPAAAWSPRRGCAIRRWPRPCSTG